MKNLLTGFFLNKSLESFENAFSMLNLLLNIFFYFLLAEFFKWTCTVH